MKRVVRRKIYLIMMVYRFNFNFNLLLFASFVVYFSLFLFFFKIFLFKNFFYICLVESLELQMVLRLQRAWPGQEYH